MSNATYTFEDSVYDINQLVPEGRKAFQLLLTAEKNVRSLEDQVIIAQAATISLHTKLQEYLVEDAIITEEEPEPEED